MKKLGKFVVASLLVMSLLVACGGKGSSDAKVKVGVSSTQVVAVDDNGEAKFNTVVVGIALSDDKVSYVSIDESEQKAKLEGDTSVINKDDTKKGLGADYGMATFTGGAEWFEQVEALEEALIGKTKDEVVAYFAGEEVKTAATITVDQFEETILKAIDNSVEVEGVAKVGLGLELKAEGVESSVDYALLAVDADGKIVKAFLDNAQEKVEVVDGALVAVSIGKTKGELKEAYGMANFPQGNGVEWFEQNNAIMDYLVGKTVADFTSAANEDVDTTVTMSIEGSQAAVKDAEANLKDLK